MKRQGFALWEFIGVFALILMGAAVLFPVFFRSRETFCGSSCFGNFRQMGVALRQYSQDFDDVFPPTSITSRSIVDSGQPMKKWMPYGWADALQPYIKNNQIYQCGFETTAGQNNPLASGYTDYWFNANLSGVATKKLNAPSAVITFGDGSYKNDLTDARYSLFALPQTWIADTSSPAYRHNSGANYAFADGHVKMLKPQQVNSMFLPR